MTLPFLSYRLSSQNQRVPSFEVAGDEQPRVYNTEDLLSGSEMDALVVAAYRQIFHEQQMLESNRQIFLESQLRAGQITVKDFIRGLVMSDAFRRLNYEANSNYRFVEICIQRLLGRNVYDQREKLAWSIVLATQGLGSFVDALLNSEEYLSNFGGTTVPYQRRRILPQRSLGERPFTQIARYDEHHLNQLRQLGQLRSLPPQIRDRSADVYRKVLWLVPVAAVALLVVTLVSIAAPQWPQG